MVEAYEDPDPLRRAALDTCYDIAYYYMDTYTSDTMKASRFGYKDTVMGFWETNPRHSYICSHGGVYGGIPKIVFSKGEWLKPQDILDDLDEGAMENTDAIFLASCFGLVQYQPYYPEERSFGRTFCDYCGVNNAIGSPVYIHGFATLLVTTYYYHFRLVYGYSAYNAINLAKQHTLAFLALAAVSWPVGFPLALIWLNANLGIPIPTLVANWVLFALFLWSLTAIATALMSFSIILVDENYY